MDQATTGTEGDDHCVSETEDDTLAQRKKRARRVSFVERDVTSIRIFEPDEDSATPPNHFPKLADDAEKQVAGYFRDNEEANRNDVESGEEGEDDHPGKFFFRALGSISPGSSIISSATSNDDRYFGPVSTDFIRHGRLSDSSTYDDHEMTMDSTAFSMHYRSLMNSNSLDLQTPLTVSPMNSSAKSFAQIPNGKSNILDFSTPTERVSPERYKNKKLSSSEKEILQVSREAIGDEINERLCNSWVPNSAVFNSPRNMTATVDEDIETNELTDDAIIRQVCNEISKNDYILKSPEHSKRKVETVALNDELADDTMADNNITESFSSKSVNHTCTGSDHVRVRGERLVSHNSLENRLKDRIKSESVERQSQNHSSYATPSTQNLCANELLKSREKRGSSYKRSISWMSVCAPSPLGSFLKDDIERSKQRISQLRPGRTPINGGKRIGPHCTTENALSVAVNLDKSRLEESLFDINHGSDTRIIPKFSESETDSQKVGALKVLNVQNSPTFIDTSLSGNLIPNKMIFGLVNAELGIQNDASEVPDFCYDSYNTPAVGSKYLQHSNAKDVLASERASIPREDSFSKAFLAANKIINQLESVDGGGKCNIDSVFKGNFMNGQPWDDEVEQHRMFRRIENCFEASKPLEQMLSKISSCNEGLLPSLAKTLHENSISMLIDRVTEQQKIKKYTSLCFHLQSLEKHKPAPENDRKKVSEMQTLLYKLVFEKAKVELLNLKVAICSKVRERVRSSTVDSQELKSFLHESWHKQGKKFSSSEASTSLDSVCFAELEFGVIEKRRKLLDKAQSYGVTIAKDPRCSEIDTSLADELNKKIVSLALRGSLQLWKLEKFSSGIKKYDILLSYREFLLQRFTITRAQMDSVHVSIEIIEEHIRKHFPCTNAIVAFAFVLKPLTEQVISSDRMRHVAQNVSFLVQNLLDVLEEIQLSLLKCKSLVRAFFVPNDRQLALELGFVDLESAVKVTIALDLTCLQCGEYPSEVLPSQIDTNNESFPSDALCNLVAGYPKILHISTCVHSLINC